MKSRNNKRFARETLKELEPEIANVRTESMRAVQETFRVSEAEYLELLRQKVEGRFKSMSAFVRSRLGLLP